MHDTSTRGAPKRRGEVATIFALAAAGALLPPACDFDDEFELNLVTHECDNDEDCEPDNVCNSTLFGRSCFERRECSVDAECAAGETCRDRSDGASDVSAPRRTTCEDIHCAEDTDCPAKFYCQSVFFGESVCRPSCDTDDDCSADSVCAGRSCSTALVCATDADCAANEATPSCRVRSTDEGAKRTTCEPVSCTSDADCPAEQTCDGAFEQCDGPPVCASDADCEGQGERCVHRLAAYDLQLVTRTTCEECTLSAAGQCL